MYCIFDVFFIIILQYMNNHSSETPFFKKEKRDTALTVRVPKSTIKKIKAFSKKYNFSQSEIIEVLINKEWNKETKENLTDK